jgi:transcriptional regulator with XRE-family HTH domain
LNPGIGDDARDDAPPGTSRRVGINRGLLSEIERGIRFPPDELLDRLEAVYGAPPSHWYDRDTLLAIQRGGAAIR